MEQTTEEVTKQLQKVSRWQTYLNDRVLPVVTTFMLKVIVSLVVYVIVSKLINKLKQWLVTKMEYDRIDQTTVVFLSNVASVVLKVLVMIGLLGYMGVNSATIVAAFGSVTVGIGLAMQGGMANFAGGVLIALLKPFAIGDYIIEVSEKNEGTVTKIDMFYTTLRTFDDKMITIPNQMLTNSSVVNLTKTGTRRIDLIVGISYRSDIDQAKRVLREIIDAENRILRDRPIDIFVDQLAASSVELGIHVFTTADQYWSTRWSLNEVIKKRFDAEGISIPYQQLDVHVDQRLE